MTALRAAASSRAAKNFWYMLLSPSSRKSVGRKSPKAEETPRRPVRVKWVAGSVSVSADQPPAARQSERRGDDDADDDDERR